MVNLKDQTTTTTAIIIITITTTTTTITKTKINVNFFRQLLIDFILIMIKYIFLVSVTAFHKTKMCPTVENN